MASVVDKLKKRKESKSEWSKTGSFLNKPDRGWIHPDEQLATSAGICYGVRYIGCLEVKESMRSLDFDTRTALAREAISRVSEAAGLKTATKRKKVDKKIGRMLGDTPCMQYAGSNVNLTITVDSIDLMIMESGEVIANHVMPGISFASGGDAETLDFVAYVAKDDINGRACHVLECGGGLSEDVITTIGQAFELRFKEYLKKQPKPVRIPDRLEQSINDGDAWGDHDENDYFNDNPSARPPSPRQRIPSEYDLPPSNLPVSDGVYSSVKESSDKFVYDTPKEHPLIDFSDGGANVYDNSEKADDGLNQDLLLDALAAQQPGVYDNPKVRQHSPTTNGNLDPFDMEPFNASLNGNMENPPLAPGGSHDPTVHNENPKKRVTPLFEEWFHGNLSRKESADFAFGSKAPVLQLQFRKFPIPWNVGEAEKLLVNDGDFLVRQSSADTEQFVLSGREHGVVKHLLLVDPEGVVRTKEHTFESVPHLINFHRSQNIPIVSQESELHLKTPISNKLTAC